MESSEKPGYSWFEKIALAIFFLFAFTGAFHFIQVNQTPGLMNPNNDIECIDFDDGLDYGLKGFVRMGNKRYPDKCIMNGKDMGMLVEYYCSYKNVPDKQIFDCSKLDKTCVNGACR